MLHALRVLFLANVFYMTGILAAEITSATEHVVISGTIMHDGATAIPAGSVIEVQLIELKGEGAAEWIVAETRIQSPAQLPIAYGIGFALEGVDKSRGHVLRVLITAHGRPSFYSVTPLYLLAWRSSIERNVFVQPVHIQVSVDDLITLVAPWRIASYRGVPDIGFSFIPLEIQSDGTVKARVVCSRIYSGRLESSKMRFADLAAATRTCPSYLIPLEQSVFAALDSVRAWRIGSSRQHLELLDEAGMVVVTLVRM